MARGPRIGRTDAVDSDVIEHSTFIAILRWANKPTGSFGVCVCVCFCLTPFLRKYSPEAGISHARSFINNEGDRFSKLNHSSFPMHSRAIPCFCICCFYDLGSVCRTMSVVRACEK